jgi:hypothetical protein
MRAWEIRQKRAQKRARELARKEKQKTKKGTETFRVVIIGRETEATDVETVIIKNEDESVLEATFDEIEAGNTLIIEGATGLIERAVVEEKVDLEEPEQEPVRELRVRTVAGP